MSSYNIELLPNGFVRIQCRQSGLVGLYEQDGSYKHGDLCRCEQVVRQWMRR